MATEKDKKITDEAQSESKLPTDVTPTPEQDTEPSKDADTKTQQANEEIERLEAELKAQQEADKTSSDDEKETRQQPAADIEPSLEPSPEPSREFANTSKNAFKHSEPSQRKFSWWGFLAFWISLAAASAVGYLWWQAKLWQNDLQASVSESQQANQRLANQSFKQANETMTQVQRHLAQLQQNQQNSNDFVVASQRDLTALSQRVKELGQSQPNTWLAAEASYLVNLAEHRLIIEKDVNTAIQLLIEANLRLTAMNDPSVFYLRTSISEDIARLSSVTTPETEAIYLSLSGLMSQVANWPFAHKYIPEPTATEPEVDLSEDVAEWRDNLAKTVDKLMTNFIRIERRDVKVEPELPPSERWFVRANISAQITAAQHASLNHQSDVYAQSLQQIELWIKQYFDQQSATVQSALNTLLALKQKSVTISLPNELSSQALLANYVNSLQAQKAGLPKAKPDNKDTKDSQDTNKKKSASEQSTPASEVQQ